MNTERLRTGVLDAYQHGPEAVVALVVTLMSELGAQMEGVSARVTTLEGENAALRAKLEMNSRNSGKPPSSDGRGLKPPQEPTRGERAEARRPARARGAHRSTE